MNLSSSIIYYLGDEVRERCVFKKKQKSLIGHPVRCSPSGRALLTNKAHVFQLFQNGNLNWLQISKESFPRDFRKALQLEGDLMESSVSPKTIN